eukprot:654525-Pleurochrysis_carterae.AAC.3
MRVSWYSRARRRSLLEQLELSHAADVERLAADARVREGRRAAQAKADSRLDARFTDSDKTAARTLDMRRGSSNCREGWWLRGRRCCVRTT